MTTEQHLDGATQAAVRSEYDFVPVRSDYVALLRNVPMMRAVTVLAWCLVAALTLAVLMTFVVVDAGGEPVGDPQELAVLLAFGVPAALILFAYAWLGGVAAWRRPANREPVLAALDADGFSHAGPSGRQSFVWGVASRARETAEAYYVYVPNGLASLVYWLPKRAVPVGEQAQVRMRIQTHVRRYQIR